MAPPNLADPADWRIVFGHPLPAKWLQFPADWRISSSNWRNFSSNWRVFRQIGGIFHQIGGFVTRNKRNSN